MDIVQNSNIIFKIVATVAFMAMLFVVGFYFYNFTSQVAIDQAIWGQFGDYVGGTLNPIFGFLSLIVLLYVLTQNERALAMSKEELALTRKELKNSANALQGQSETLKTQRFEQTFFSLLDTYHKSCNSIVFREEKGNMALKMLLDELHCFLRNYLDPVQEYYIKPRRYESEYTEITGMKSKFDEFKARASSYLMSFFETTKVILKFIDSPTSENKQVYADIFRAQLSAHETVLLFYYAICNSSESNMLELSIKYDFFKYLDKSLLANQEIDLKIFAELQDKYSKNKD